MQTPHEIHWKVAKMILRYVHGIVQFGIHYSSGGTPLLVGFTDSYWVGDPDDQNSTADNVFNLGSGPVTLIIESMPPIRATPRNSKIVSQMGKASF